MTLFSEITEGLRISWEALRGNLLRSVLTTVGIVIGVVTVTLMATALAWLDRTFRDNVSFMGTDVLYVSQRDWFVNSQAKWEEANRRPKISLHQAREIERLTSGVHGVAPSIEHWIDSVQYKDRTASTVILVGTNEQYPVTSGVTLTSGRFMTKTEAYANRDLCVIGSDIAEKLFLNEPPLGKTLRFGNQSFEVIGVMEKRGMVMGRMNLDNRIIIPIQRMIRGFRYDPSCTVQVKVGDAAQLETAREELRGLIRKVRKVPPGKNDDFAINHQEALLDQFKTASLVIATAGFFITGLSLFVGGIGIMNIMFVSVTERTPEIGIRKAIGARRRTILFQFLIEAACICLFGGLIAVALAGGAVEIARPYVPKIGLSPSIVLLALSVAVLTGLISGFLPAWRAARMRPVDALRKE